MSKELKEGPCAENARSWVVWLGLCPGEMRVENQVGLRAPDSAKDRRLNQLVFILFYF